LKSFVVAFPDGWYLRDNTATGDINQAERFPSEAAAQLALARREHHFQSTSFSKAPVPYTGARIIIITASR